MRLSVLIGAALAALTATVATAEIRIRNHPGGLLQESASAFARMRAMGETVVIDGRCVSACTLVLGIMPPDRLCVTPRAMFGFHAAWAYDMEGRQVDSPHGTAAMLATYPAEVRRWLASKGGLSRRLLVLRGRELTSMFRRCE